jgi:hypothetical protein
MTYAGRGKKAEARAEIEKALPGLSGPDAADARRALDTLR